MEACEDEGSATSTRRAVEDEGNYWGFILGSLLLIGGIVMMAIPGPATTLGIVLAAVGPVVFVVQAAS